MEQAGKPVKVLQKILRFAGTMTRRLSMPKF